MAKEPLARQAELELGRAKLNGERFIAACQVIMQEAGGVLVSYDTLSAGVRDWIKEIRLRSEEKATVRVQRADYRQRAPQQAIGPEDVCGHGPLACGRLYSPPWLIARPVPNR